MLRASNATKGQTLVEMLVSLGVVVWLAAMLIGYSRNADARGRLVRERQRMVLDLRRAQGWALATREFLPGESPCGYGVYLDLAGSRYIMFADRAANPSAPCTSANLRRNPGGSEDVEAVQLGRGIIISAADATEILFLSALPRAILYPSAETAIITLAVEQDLSVTARIRVTTAGEITAVP